MFLTHALSCPKARLVITRHNELRNLQLKYWVKFVKMWVSSRYLHHWWGKNFRNFQIQATKEKQVCQLEGYGLTGKRSFFDLKVFNPLARCHLSIITIVFELFIKKMKAKRNGSMTSESFKWNMDSSHHLCFHVLEEWVENAAVSFHMLVSVWLTEEKSLKARLVHG